MHFSVLILEHSGLNEVSLMVSLSFFLLQDNFIVTSHGDNCRYKGNNEKAYARRLTGGAFRGRQKINKLASK